MLIGIVGSALTRMDAKHNKTMTTAMVASLIFVRGIFMIPREKYPGAASISYRYTLYIISYLFI